MPQPAAAGATLLQQVYVKGKEAYKTVPYKVKGSTGSASIEAWELNRLAMAGAGVLCASSWPLLALAESGHPNRRAAAIAAWATCLQG